MLRFLTGFNRLSISLAALSCGAIAYNNWALGRWLNPVLFKANGSVSEFSVHSQPHYLIFKLLDIISGFFLALAALLLLSYSKSSRRIRYIFVLTVILGVANVADALSTLPCSITLSRSCSIPVSLSLSNYQIPAHGYTSSVIAVCYLLLPLGGLLIGLKQRIWPVIAISSISLADAILSLGLALANYINNHSLSVRTSGAGQEVQMTLLGIWLIITYFFLVRHLNWQSSRSARINDNGATKAS